MKVVRELSGRPAMILGHCNEPPAAAISEGVYRLIPVGTLHEDGRVTPSGILFGAIQEIAFPLRQATLPLADGTTRKELCVIADPNGPEPKFLPGWRPE